MKRTRIVIWLLACSLAWAAGPPVATAGPVAVNVDISLFHDALAPHGDWVQSARFGLAWTPTSVAHGWRPYTMGHWVYTDCNWTWVGDEEWSWATDHYGRWSFDPSYGWVWVPGAQWGPAWVAWRYGNGYVGWAPLPPGVGLDMARVNFETAIDPLAFTFVNEHFLISANLGPHIIPEARNVTYIRVTNNITNYTIVDNRVVNRGVDVGRIERIVGRPVPRMPMRDVDSFEAATRGRSRGQEVAFYRPRIGPAGRGWRQVTPPARFTRPPGQAPTRDELKETARLQRAEDRERHSLLKEHEREERSLPAGPSLDELRQRHAAELKAQEQHEMRERQVLQAHQQLVRGQAPASPENRNPRGNSKKH